MSREARGRESNPANVAVRAVVESNVVVVESKQCRRNRAATQGNQSPMASMVSATSFELLHLELATRIIERDEPAVAQYRLDAMGFDVVPITETLA